MLPDEWQKKLVDLNVEPLSDAHLTWADMVFVSAMIVQKDSARQIIKRCKDYGKKVVAGGPVFTTQHEQFEGVDHLVLNEAEITLPLFLPGSGRRPTENAVFILRAARYYSDAGASLVADRFKELCYHGHPVFAGMPVQLRILRYYNYERKNPPGKIIRSDEKGIPGPVRCRMAEISLHRR